MDAVDCTDELSAGGPKEPDAFPSLSVWQVLMGLTLIFETGTQASFLLLD